MLLDQRFFQRTDGVAHNGTMTMLEAYKAVYARSTMVLFSRKTKTPLAALTLKTDDVGCLSMLTGRPTPTGKRDPYFQGMLNMPNQSFDFVISNLTDIGMINFNILHTPDYRVSAVDPGPAYGINEVNELNKNQSYIIEADQRNNRKMILTGKTSSVIDAVTGVETQVEVTVKDSEKEEKATGLYFYLSVVPDKACKELVNKFAEGTVWKVTPGFVRRVAQPLPPPAPRRDFGTMMRRHGGNFSSGSQGEIDLFEEEDLGLAGGSLQGSFTSSLRGSAGLQGSAGPVGSQTRNRGSFTPSLLVGSSTGPVGSLTRSRGGGRMRLQASAPARNSQAKHFAELVDVGSTQAADLRYGRQVQVRSGYTGRDYSYEHCSEPTVLCMSIWQGMKFFPLVDIEKDLNEEVQEWIQNEGKALIESLNKVFKTDKCVMDLESEADTIICACGHQCINHANVDSKLQKCPLCRSKITAFVKADGILL